MPDLHVQQVTDPVAMHGEGPVWSSRWGGLRYLDMLRGDILSLAADGTVNRRHVDSVVAAIRPSTVGGMVVATKRGFTIFTPDGTPDKLPDLWSDPAIRMNEGGCDPDGRFYCGSMAYDETRHAGNLYRLDTDRTVTTVLHDVTVSNGLAWSPDGTRAYYVDSAAQSVDVFDYSLDSGLTDRRPLVRIPIRDGVPDGISVDAAGHIWVAMWKGGAIRRYTTAGQLDAVITLPVSQVTACTFGGPNLDQLFITTSRHHLDPATAGEAGAVFVATTGQAGLPVTEFGPPLAKKV